jgi:hypothetical protein
VTLVCIWLGPSQVRICSIYRCLLYVGSILKEAPSDDVAHRVSQQAQVDLRGKPADNYKMLEPLCEALMKLGWHAEVIQIPSELMDEIVLKKAMAVHKIEQDRLDPSQRTAFNKNLPEAEVGKMYYGGWTVAGFPTSRKMLAAGKVVKVFFSDFCHAKKLAKGSFALLVAQDANHHIVPLAIMHTIMPEAGHTWDDLVGPALKYYGKLLDDVDVVHISDGDKGAANCFDALLEWAQAFICSQHRGVTMTGKHGKGAKELYQFWASATSVAEQEKLKTQMPPKMVAEINKLPDRFQCVLANPGIMHSITTSNVVESGNKAINEIRECPDEFYALLRAIEYFQEKFYAHKEAAQMAKTTATPRVIAKIAAKLVIADTLKRPVNWIVRNVDCLKARVYHDGPKFFEVCINGPGDFSCTCGAPRVNHELCIHVVKVARAGDIEPQTLVYPEDTVKCWKEGYDAAGDFTLPVLSSIVVPKKARLERPLAVPNRRGAPTKDRRKGAVDFQQQQQKYKKMMKAQPRRRPTIAAPVEDEDEDEEPVADPPAADPPLQQARPYRVPQHARTRSSPAAAPPAAEPPALDPPMLQPKQKTSKKRAVATARAQRLGKLDIFDLGAFFVKVSTISKSRHRTQEEPADEPVLPSISRAEKHTTIAARILRPVKHVISEIRVR